MTPSITISRFGRGFPLHKFDSAQAPGSIRSAHFVVSTTYIKLGTPPFLMMASRLKEESLAILPIAQMACSTRPGVLDFNILINSSIAPLSIMDWHCCGVPEAMFARAQVA